MSTPFKPIGGALHPLERGDTYAACHGCGRRFPDDTLDADDLCPGCTRTARRPTFKQENYDDR